MSVFVGKSKYQISVVIPTYNRSAFLIKAVESALTQNYNNLIIKIYDNASEDDTEQVVQKLIERDQRIIYHRHPFNIGMMANYQFALSQISTPFFSLLSDDDFLLPFFCETALDGFEKHPEAAISVCGVRVVNEQGQLVSDPTSIWKRDGYYAPGEGVVEMFINPVFPIGVLFQTHLVCNINPDLNPEVQIRWDTDYILRIISSNYWFLNRKHCAVFLVHDNGYSSSRYKNMLSSADAFSKHILATEIILKNLLIQNSLDKKIKNNLKKSFLFRIRRDFIHFQRVYFYKKKALNAIKLTKMYWKFLGFDFYSFLFYLFSFFSILIFIFDKVLKKQVLIIYNRLFRAVLKNPR